MAGYDLSTEILLAYDRVCSELVAWCVSSLGPGTVVQHGRWYSELRWMIVIVRDMWIISGSDIYDYLVVGMHHASSLMWLVYWIMIVIHHMLLYSMMLYCIFMMRYIFGWGYNMLIHKNWFYFYICHWGYIYICSYMASYCFLIHII